MKVGIIGGGITGLTTALSLHKVGIDSVVFERANELNEIGAGIWLQPNAIKVLNWLGIKDRIKEQGIELKKMEITNSHLKAFKKIKSEVVSDEEGNQTIAIHRGRLQKTLYTEVQKVAEVQLGKKYLRHSEKADSINIQFENGEEQVDLLLGADGIDSLIRKALFPQSSLRSSGQLCWRGISKMKLPDAYNNLGQEAWGKQIRFGFSEISENEVYWFAVAKEEHVHKENGRDTKEYISHLFGAFSPVIAQLIANTDAPGIHRAKIKDLKRLKTWYKDKVCLIGDAAHATTPNMGQGACQGIEDAYYMSRNLSKALNDPNQAFKQFELERRKKVDYVVNNSWQFGKMAHSGIGQQIMKLILKSTPESVINSQMNKLYHLDK